LRAGPAKLRAGVGVNVIRLRVAPKGFMQRPLGFFPNPKGLWDGQMLSFALIFYTPVKTGEKVRR